MVEIREGGEDGGGFEGLVVGVGGVDGEGEGVGDVGDWIGDGFGSGCGIF